MRSPALNPRVRCGRLAHAQPEDTIEPRLWLDRNAVIRGLVARLVCQALIDLQLFAANTNKSTRASATARRNAAHALLWLNGQLVAQRISFAECCDMLGFEPAESRERLLAQVEPAALAELGHTMPHTTVNRISAAMFARPTRRKASAAMSKQGRRRLPSDRN